MKDVGLRIRVQRDLREAFLEVCRAQDKPGHRELVGSEQQQDFSLHRVGILEFVDGEM